MMVEEKRSDREELERVGKEIKEKKKMYEPCNLSSMY
jgi:hypothetical protein